MRRTELHDPLWNAIASFGLDSLNIRTRLGTPGVGPPGPEASAAVPLGDPEAALSQLLHDVGDCHRCRLGDSRKHIVFGEGNPSSGVLFVGEGPGATEDETGRPFVGKAGQLLDRILGAIDMDRTGCYIANVVKCRPPGNRVPAADEVGACAWILERQIEAMRPRVIVALGASAASALLETRRGLASLRGSFHSRGGVPLLATYHPAALLRTPALKRPVWEDMKKLRAFLDGRAEGA